MYSDILLLQPYYYIQYFKSFKFWAKTLYTSTSSFAFIPVLYHYMYVTHLQNFIISF